MNREEIIKMAREVGFKVDWQHADIAEIKTKRLEDFANLVAVAEREACAVIAFNAKTYIEAANAIRARGK